MKKIIFYIIIALIFVGCEDALQFDTLTSGDATVYPESIENAEQMMAGIYTTMNNAQRFVDRSYFFACEVASDDKLGGGGVNDINAQAIESFMYADPEMMAHAWQQKYYGIYRANLAIETLDNASFDSEDQKNQFKGEAYFLRAWFYYQLATLFGEVPLTTSTEAENLAAATSEELYGQIASDLKTAIEIMPDYQYTAVQDGRVTRWAAEALMARIFLFYTGFYNQDALPLADGSMVTKQNVIDWLDDCIKNSGHQLVDNYLELWPYTNSATLADLDEMENSFIKEYIDETGEELTYACDNGARSPETMFAIRFSNFSDWGVKRGYSNQYMLYFALRGLQSLENTFPYAGGWGQGNSVPESLVSQWQEDQPDDVRLWASVIDIEKELIPQGYNRGAWDFVLESNYWGRKYNGVTARDDDGSIKNDYSVVMYDNNDNNQLSHTDDLIYIRFADVLLMMSELTEDAQYMNLVRARAELDPVEYTLENIKKERRYELAFEGLRWNDMRRWGDAYAKAGLESQVGVSIFNFGKAATFEPLTPKGYSTRYDETKGFFAIPQQQINMSENNLEQNEGYKNGEGLYPGWSN
jgi:hypothetical protein